MTTHTYLRQANRTRAARRVASAPRRAQRAETQVAEVRVGDTVVAQDGALGTIERIIRSETRAPIYVVVAVRGFLRRRYPVVPWFLVTAVDRSRRSIHIRGRRALMSRFSETLPLVV
ncbi:MAG: PRC-barrel domain-containing protein [Actinomycetota bacterium]